MAQTVLDLSADSVRLYKTQDPYLCFVYTIHIQDPSISKIVSHSPRFGVALAKMRTRQMATNKRSARNFLKAALKVGKHPHPQKTSKEFAFWVKHARLDDVFQYLTE